MCGPRVLGTSFSLDEKGVMAVPSICPSQTDHLDVDLLVLCGVYWLRYSFDDGRTQPGHVSFSSMGEPKVSSSLWLSTVTKFSTFFILDSLFGETSKLYCTRCNSTHLF